MKRIEKRIERNCTNKYGIDLCLNAHKNAACLTDLSYTDAKKDFFFRIKKRT